MTFMATKITRNSLKYPKTPSEIADALEEWYDNGQKGWFEKGRARFIGFVSALRSLEDE
jgi:hypothetical protein